MSSFDNFCGLLQIQPKERGGRVQFSLNPIQKLYCKRRTALDIVLKPRQIGFTTLEQARDVYKFVTVPGARVVMVVQSQADQQPFQEAVRKFNIFFDSLKSVGVNLNFSRAAAGTWEIAERDASLSVIQAGASRAAASKKGRGGTVLRLHTTECAFYEHPEDTFNSLLECVPGPEVGSEVVHESTPNGASGWYYEQWRRASDGESGYEPHFFKWWDHPEYQLRLESGEVVEPQDDGEARLVSLGVTPEQLKWYRRKCADKGDRKKTDQEYPSDAESCFVTSGRSFFDVEKVDALLESAKPPLRTELGGKLKIYAEPLRGHDYVVSADTSEGDATGGDPDYSAAQVFERGTGRHMATFRDRIKPFEFGEVLAKIARIYNGATLAIERNNHGHAVIQATVRVHGYRRLYVHSDGKPGWNTNAANRPLILDRLQSALDGGHFTTQDRTTLSEMRTFIVKENGRAEAAQGSHDDTVMSAAIGWAVLTTNVPRRSIDNVVP